MYFFSFVLIFFFTLFGISVNHFVVSSLFTLLYYLIFFIKTSYFFVIFLLFLLFFQLLHLFRFDFVPYYIYIYGGFCTFAVTSLMNSFTSLLFSLPVSHYFLSLFLVFSLIVIFNLILALTKKMV